MPEFCSSAARCKRLKTPLDTWRRRRAAKSCYVVAGSRDGVLGSGAERSFETTLGSGLPSPLPRRSDCAKKPFTCGLSSPFPRRSDCAKKPFTCGLSSTSPLRRDCAKKPFTWGLSSPFPRRNDCVKKPFTCGLPSPFPRRSDCAKKAFTCVFSAPQSPGSETAGPDSGSNASTSVGEDSELSTPKAATSLDRIMRTLAAEPWPAGRFEHIGRLQDAARNQGSVELMFDSGGIGKVAVKRMPNTWMQGDAAAFASTSGQASEQPWFDLAVVRWLKAQHFPYSCALHGVFRDDRVTYVVFELATEGDLLRWCQTLAEQGDAREGTLRPVMHRMCSAVAWLHDLGIAHCDLSLENVLLTKGVVGEELEVKLIDFGMATTQRTLVGQVRGKPSYQAPEMHLRNVPYDPFLSDVFAMGVTFYCLAAQDYPWMSTVPGMCQHWHLMTVRSLRVLLGRRKLRNSQPEKFLSEAMSANFIELLEGMLTVKPGKRLTLGESVWSDVDMFPKSSARKKKSVWELPWMSSYPL